MLGCEAARLDVDDHPAGGRVVGAAERQIESAREGEPVVAHLHALGHLGGGTPAAPQRREGVEEAGGQRDALAAQLRDGGFVTAGQPVTEAVLAVDDAGDRVVDQLGRVALAVQVHRQLDRLVAHRATGQGHAPLEGSLLLGQETDLTSVDRGEVALADEQPVGARVGLAAAVDHGHQLAFEQVADVHPQGRSIRRPLVGRRSQTFEVLRLHRVHRREVVHRAPPYRRCVGVDRPTP